MLLLRNSLTNVNMGDLGQTNGTSFPYILWFISYSQRYNLCYIINWNKLTNKNKVNNCIQKPYFISRLTNK